MLILYSKLVSFRSKTVRDIAMHGRIACRLDIAKKATHSVGYHVYILIVNHPMLYQLLIIIMFGYWWSTDRNQHRNTEMTKYSDKYKKSKSLPICSAEQLVSSILLARSSVCYFLLCRHIVTW